MIELAKMRVAIIGLGQIGGSIGLDLVKGRLVAEVVGFDIATRVGLTAISLGAIDRDAASLEKAVKDADLVVLAMPIRQIIRTIPTIAAIAPKECTVMDVAGTKVEIMQAVTENRLGSRYVSTHPMAGNEGSGIEAASSGKFAGKQIALTVDDAIDPDRLETVCDLVRSLGAQPFLIEAERHDRLIALTSHLPYATALALAGIMADEAANDDAPLRLIGGSFRSAVRVAGSSPDLTADMFFTNGKPLCSAIDLLIGQLQRLRAMVEAGAEGGLRKESENARRVRRSFKAD